MDSALIVRRARVVAADASRGEVVRWLDRVPVESLGLAPGELFYVPRLAIPLPSGERMAGGRVSDRILESLRRLLESADHESDAGFLPGRPYRFTSRGRYLAWLVALWVGNGSAEARAAFRAATGDASLAHWQRTVLLRNGIDLATTIARLAEIGCAAAWIARLEPPDFVLAYRALEERFPISLAPVPESPSGRPRQGAISSEALSAAARSTVQDLVLQLEARGNGMACLSPPGRILLLTAIALIRSPSHPPARTAALIDMIAVFETAEAEALLPPEPARSRSVSDDPAPPIIARTGATPPSDPAPAGAGKPETRRATLSAGTGKSETRRHTRSLPRRRDARHHVGVPNGEAPTSVASDTGPDADDSPVLAVAHPGPLRTPAAPFLTPDTHFETGFGGLLLLFNAFIALGLYPDFTQPRGARLEPSPLWLADRIGRYWFGARYRGDPLARWIAANAAPGRLPSLWRAAPDWLTGFETHAMPRRAVRHGRVTLWHPAGFPLLDEDEGRAPRRASRVSGFRHPHIAMISPARLPSKPADRWAACLALYLDARLRLLCGAGLSLLALPARIQIRDLDLGAHFALDRHPIQLRIAGLDRDPGWQPAEGRAIAFMFE